MATALVGCGGDDDGNQSVDAGGDLDALLIDGPVDAPPEPTPAFTISYGGGELAIDEVGIRDTFRFGGATYYSVISVGLHSAETDCSIVMRPAFVAFGTESTTSRFFKTVLIDLSTSTLLDDECGWDDAHIMRGLAGAPVEVGFIQARFAEDRPALDVVYVGSLWLPDDTANLIRVAGGNGYAMAADGTVDGATRVQPLGGTLDRGLYQF